MTRIAICTIAITCGGKPVQGARFARTSASHFIAAAIRMKTGRSSQGFSR
jgi:hypothetical protein